MCVAPYLIIKILFLENKIYYSPSSSKKAACILRQVVSLANLTKFGIERNFFAGIPIK